MHKSIKKIEYLSNHQESSILSAMNVDPSLQAGRTSVKDFFWFASHQK